MKFIIKYSNHLIVLTIIAGIILSLTAVGRLNEKTLIRQSQEEAQHLTTAIATFRSLYTSEVISRLQGTGIQITHDYNPN